MVGKHSMVRVDGLNQINNYMLHKENMNLYKHLAFTEVMSFSRHY